MATTSSGLLRRALDGHGGRERWEAASEASAHIRCSGVALRSKLAAGPLREYDATVSVKEPRTVIEPYPSPGLRGVFEGDRVRIEDAATGATLSERANPRERFPGGMRTVRWDRLDALYFAGYALWNYLTFPYLLTHDAPMADRGAYRCWSRWSSTRCAYARASAPSRGSARQ